MDERTNPTPDLRAFETGVSLADYLMVIIRRKWAVVIVFLTTVVMASLVSLRMPRVYETNVTIKINQRITGQNILATFYFDPNFLQTEIETIRSRAIMTAVANRLGLTYRIVAIPPRLQGSLAEVTIADGTPPGLLIITFDDPVTFKVTLDQKPQGGGTVGTRFDGEFGSILVETEKARRGDRIDVQIKDLEAAVGMVRSSFTVRPIENVNMVRVIARGRDPDQVTDMANGIADAYVKASLEDKRLQATSTRIFIEDQIERTAQNLRDTERELENFKRANGIVDITAETQHYNDILGSLESELLKYSLERQITAAELGIMKNRQGRAAGETGGYPPDALMGSSFAAGSSLAALENQVIELQRQRNELLQTRTPDHPAVKAKDAQIHAVQDEMARALNDVLERGELATNIELSDERIKVLEGNIREYKDLTARIPQKEMELNRISRAYEVNERVYEMLLEKLQEAKINEAMETADIRVVDYALVPKAPISPNYAKNILVGVFLGVFLGIGVAYALEFADTSLNSVEEVERRLGRSVIGIIPRITHNPAERLLNKPDKYDSYFVTYNFPKSPVAEAYRTLRTAILASGVDVDVASILITSTGLSEGKTNTAFNLAMVFAQVGNKVLLMDCDLRRAKIHRALNMRRVPGLAEVIMGQAPLDEAVRPTTIENLAVLPSGEVPPNPSELLGSKKFEKILAQLKGKYDRIVMDAPPVLAVTDALVLSGMTDGVCFVVCAGRTDRNAARRGLSLLERAGCKLLGVVFNQVDMARVFGSYGYKYYSQYYKSYQEGTDAS